ncbi:hypothetical protein BDV93DRAFT_545376 [Ceratobasidium sp. AG-I]|nr:hypothetical protein BDV93DRAFT_545376 [Ceratobasidium sp. AG-I]
MPLVTSLQPTRPRRQTHDKLPHRSRDRQTPIKLWPVHAPTSPALRRLSLQRCPPRWTHDRGSLLAGREGARPAQEALTKPNRQSDAAWSRKAARSTRYSQTQDARRWTVTGRRAAARERMENEELWPPEAVFYTPSKHSGGAPRAAPLSIGGRTPSKPVAADIGVGPPCANPAP